MSATVTVNTLSEALVPLAAINNEAVIEFKSDSVTIRAREKATPTFIEATLREPAFQHYSITPTSIGVNLSNLQYFLQLAGFDSRITLDITTNGILQLHTPTFTGWFENISNVTDTPLPTTAAEATVVIRSKNRDMHRSVTAADLTGEHINLHLSADRSLTASARNILDSMVCEFSPDNILRIDPSPVDVTLSVEHFGNLFHAIRPDNRPVTLGLHNDAPISLSAPIADGAGRLSSYIAQSDPEQGREPPNPDSDVHNPWADPPSPSWITNVD